MLAGMPPSRDESDDDLPSLVTRACVEAGEQAKGYTDYERRRHYAIVAFDCDDEFTHDLIRAIGAATGQSLEPVPHKALTAIIPHVLAARLAREYGYPSLPDLPDPGPGKMRMFVFYGEGAAQTGPFLIEDAAAVARALEQQENAARAFVARIMEAKHALIAKAVGLVLSKPGLSHTQVVVVFGTRSDNIRLIYRVLAAPRAQLGFPPELPPGVPVMTVDSNEFRRVLDEHFVEPPTLDPAELGLNQVWVAFFVEPRGVFVHRTESVPMARGGAA
jgi:hypothetical protein